jgi:hypothetical protein
VLHDRISVGAIFDTALVFSAASQFPVGESLMQAILSPQEAGDLLFYLMNVMPTVSASTTTPSMAHLLLYRRGLDARYGAVTADALEERYRDSHFKGTISKEWAKTNTKPKSKRSR